jgi:hypothetical protein
MVLVPVAWPSGCACGPISPGQWQLPGLLETEAFRKTGFQAPTISQPSDSRRILPFHWHRVTQEETRLSPSQVK